mmetsp:Transcript_9386/g.14307  ORF Transcript_9386/g.14307 Transcript_9386/m.14307 type:complete len:90 (+) Transcript_9386:4229-4498(+)
MFTTNKQNLKPILSTSGQSVQVQPSAKTLKDPQTKKPSTMAVVEGVEKLNDSSIEQVNPQKLKIEKEATTKQLEKQLGSNKMSRQTKRS